MDKHYEEFVRAREEREKRRKALRRKRRIQKAAGILILVIAFAASTIGMALEGCLLEWLAACAIAGILSLAVCLIVE